MALLLASHCADLAFADASPNLPKSPAKLVAPLQRAKKVPPEFDWLVCRPQPAAIHSSTAFYLHGAVTLWTNAQWQMHSLCSCCGRLGAFALWWIVAVTRHRLWLGLLE